MRSPSRSKPDNGHYLLRASARLSFLLALVGLGTAPVFILPSGLPQPSDVLLLFASILFVVRYAGSVDEGSIWRAAPLILFFVYAIAVDIAFFFVRGDPRFLTGASYIAFNFVVFLGFYIAARVEPERMSRHVLAGVFVGALGLVASIPWSAGQFGSRLSLSFDNPNQLGYFALLSMARRGGRVAGVVFGVACLFLVTLSLSKAAIFGFASLLFFLFFRVSPTQKISWFFVAVSLVALLISSGLAQKWTVLSGLVDRVASVGSDSDDNLAARGYGRIVEHPGYLLFGAGDSGHERWGVASKSELHSSWGTIVFGYGVVGAVPLMFGVASVLLRGGLSVLPALSAVGLYGITHQGLRQPQLWIIIALASIVADGKVKPGRIDEV